MTATDWIAALDLIQHPEGGWYREVYRSDESIPRDALNGRCDGARPFVTSIYFLLAGSEISHLHRLCSDELWYYHAGGSATIHMISPAGEHSEHLIGNDAGSGDSFSVVIPAGTWFGAAVNDPSPYLLVSCAVAPGFEFADFELGDRSELLAQFPQHDQLIRRFTR